ncbi:nitrate/sulfonate/bicarbonate ABC transporter ATP-binding protein [Thermocladium modestius]|uniref:Nitrate/sulfonate/bicarbonate ABC transporter ATP-binding protein n=2 Tax=Thermocladium modestius TaxID=62609 RepID=A0A830GTB7_9CREN|nr:ABC transporter ATP-binding protein [Thermocladium modestius]GGP18954.1 nitrate/sulfonate/bicarbonate ABC transporter ATP-binding protein [Thermocladium modestius]
MIGVSFSYRTEKGVMPVLRGVSFDAGENQFVSIIAPSGTGKTTLLKIISGLVKPDEGRVLLMGEEVTGPTPLISMIYQDFALYPWLTAVQNVELALLHKRLPREERRRRAQSMLELVGLGGFEDYYPREMSGGMRQRVAIARALVAEPVVLLMDEPFASLDAITAEGLRREVLDIVFSRESTVKSVIMVSHNIEEVVELSDKVVILGGRPATVVAQVPIELPRPRSSRDPTFNEVVDRLYSVISTAVKEAR